MAIVMIGIPTANMRTEIDTIKNHLPPPISSNISSSYGKLLLFVTSGGLTMGQVPQGHEVKGSHESAPEQME